jgi:precorrin-3B synthase
MAATGAATTRGTGSCDVRGLAAPLDRALCARPGLAALPGRFLFALDDGRGDVAAEDPDLCWQATGTLLVAGVPAADVAAVDAVDVLLDAAEAFLALRAADGGGAWRAAELADAPAQIAAALAERASGGHGRMAARTGLRPWQQGGLTATTCTQSHLAGAPGPGAGTAEPPSRGVDGPPAAATPGPVARDDGGVALVVAPLLGELTSAQARLLADAGPTAVVTPWRTVVLPDPFVSTADLAAAGFVVEPGPAADVSACAGRPGCAKALADVRADAIAGLGRLPTGRLHVSGCARRCGAPRTAHVDAVALAGGGYLVDGVPSPGLAP